MISNSVTAFRLLLIVPLFLTLLFHGPGWIALALFLAAGGLDVIDGKLARSLGEVSDFGAMLDLIGDRMLTFTAAAGLIAAGTLSPWSVGFAAMLVGRDIFAAAFAEALKGRAVITPSRLEPLKIVFSFAGLGLAMLPAPRYPQIGLPQGDVVTVLLGVAALLAAVTLATYWRQTVAALSSG